MPSKKKTTKQPVGYVVYGCERLRDGLEEWAKAFDNLPAALALMEENAKILTEEIDRLRRLNESLVARVAAQSELLTARAGKGGGA